MATQVKPGTRCECRDHQHITHAIDTGPGFRGPDRVYDCTREAVRMVTVRGSIQDMDGLTIAPEAYREVPMCSPCAAYHEARQGSGSCDRVSHSPDGPESNPVLAQEEEGPPEPVAIPVCMGCGCQMSEREYREQGACNDCRPDHEARQKESA